MKFLNVLKKNYNEDIRDNEIEKYAIKKSNIAIKYAKSFQKKLDYSQKSISDLEEILDFYSEDIFKSKPTENQIWSMSIIFGSYLGETMLKNGLAKKGYKWGKDNSSNIPILYKSESDYLIAPNDKVYKRLVNGKEDSVISFYDVCMDLID